jgi:prophage antirepressor-like protein
MNTATLPAAVEFSGTSLTVIDRAGVPHLSAIDLARALGYADEGAVARIYRAHASEFTAGMSETVDSTVSGNLRSRHRIFSPRGCHLIAMFSRTKPAARFRRWVLDVLENLVAAPSPAQGRLQLGTHYHAEADRVARQWFDRARAEAAGGPRATMPAFDQRVLEGLVLEQLSQARFMVSFDHQHRMRIEAVPEGAVIVPMRESEDVQRFMDRSVPRHFLPVALMAAANRLANAS